VKKNGISKTGPIKKKGGIEMDFLRCTGKGFNSFFRLEKALPGGGEGQGFGKFRVGKR